MDGQAVAPAAGTILNALATGRGAAFAIDLSTTATVRLTDDGTVTGAVSEEPGADTTLIERAAALTVSTYATFARETGDVDSKTIGVEVRTESDVPMAGGLKSSSAAANATVLATLDALGIDVEANDSHRETPSRLDACRLGVNAAREAGVTVTGAFDDASASMLGGVTVTDNENDELLVREGDVPSRALVYTPEARAYSADADVAACDRIAPMARIVEELALDGRFGDAMTANGFAFCAALGFSTDPMLDVLPDVAGVSLSGTGPSYVALGTSAELRAVRSRWDERPGSTRLLDTRTDGARQL